MPVQPPGTLSPMNRSALIVWGGWDGHEPEAVAGLFQDILEAQQFDVEVSSTLDSFLDADRLATLSLIVPIWTMGKITPEQRKPVTEAVAKHGVGLAGCHGGMCDAFREDTEWQVMTGGQWVAHPGNDGVTYDVKICRDTPHEITDGVSDFRVVSEQYYLHTDPGNTVLAYSEFPSPSVAEEGLISACRMPQVWVRRYGKGRVFYNALGHHRDVLEAPVPRLLMERGFRWAAKP